MPGTFDVFGLVENPFRIVPDPRYAYRGADFAWTRRGLRDAIENRCGTVAVIGPGGLGKTTLLELLAGDLAATPERWHVVSVSCDPRARPETILRRIPDRRADLTRVALIDEAQHLGAEGLRSVLAALAPKDPGCVVLLAGRPSLDDLLDRNDVRRECGPLRRWRLSPLSEPEVADYVAQRLKAAGGPRDLFTPDAIAALARHSRGRPRDINALATTALSLAARSRRRVVETALVEQAALLAHGAVHPGGAVQPGEAPNHGARHRASHSAWDRRTRGIPAIAFASGTALAVAGIAALVALPDSPPPVRPMPPPGPLVTQRVETTTPTPAPEPPPPAVPPPVSAPATPAAPAIPAVPNVPSEPPTVAARAEPPAIPEVPPDPPALAPPEPGTGEEAGIAQGARAQGETTQGPMNESPAEAAPPEPPSPETAQQALDPPAPEPQASEPPAPEAPAQELAASEPVTPEPPAPEPPVSASPAPEPPAPEPAAPEPVAPAPREPSIASLLARAEQQIRDTALTTPKGANAAETLATVLERAPGHPEAKRLRAEIGNRYAELAATARRKGQPRQAEAFLAKARAFAPDLPRLAERSVDPPPEPKPAREPEAAPDPPAQIEPPAAAPAPPAAATPPVVVAAAPVPDRPRRPLLPRDLIDSRRLEQALASGGDPNTRLDGGETPLIRAVRAGRHDFVDLLLQSGANPNAANASGATALMYAAWNGDARSVQTLLEHGARTETSNVDGRTALMAAATRGHADVVRLLVEGGAEINARNAFGWTALMYAARAGHRDVVRDLLMLGADARQLAKIER